MSFWRRHGFVTLLFAAVGPNIVAAIVNIAYNRSELIDRIPGAEPVFQNVEMVINSIAFPIGIVLLIILAVPVTRAVRRAKTGGSTWLLRRCLVLGDYAAGVSLVLWLIAGVAYPVALCAALGIQSVSFFVHFLVSLALCGLIAAVYPFFGVAFFAARVLVPALIRDRRLNAEELSEMERLKRRTGLYLLLAAMAPMLTVGAWAAFGTENRTGLGVLSRHRPDRFRLRLRCVPRHPGRPGGIEPGGRPSKERRLTMRDIRFH